LVTGQTWPALLGSLLRGEDLTAADTAWAMGEVMAGEATPAQVAGFVVALRAKGETPDEVAGLVSVMLEHAAPVTVSGRVVDTCGTGGDRSNTVNISTMAALVVAGAGVPVVKHGNRAASSACGSADLLEAVGVSDRRLAPVMAGVLAQRGADALVFRGDDGLDELTTTGTSTVWVVQGGTVLETTFDPASLGVARASLEQLRGADAAYNAGVARALLAGERGPVRDAVLLNAAAAVAAFDGGTGALVERLQAGWDRAAAALDGGDAARVLDRWVTVGGALR